MGWRPKIKKVTLNFSKLEYFGSFGGVIQNLNLLGKNLHNRGSGARCENPKIILKYLKTRVLRVI